MNTAVRDVMTTRVVCVRQDASFKEMATGLRENRVSAFPVLDDDGKVIGVVSEADLLAAWPGSSAEPTCSPSSAARVPQCAARPI
jgi:CBS-domain-containing membrane protein